MGYERVTRTLLEVEPYGWRVCASFAGLCKATTEMDLLMATLVEGYDNMIYMYVLFWFSLWPFCLVAEKLNESDRKIIALVKILVFEGFMNYDFGF